MSTRERPHDELISRIMSERRSLMHLPVS